MAGKVLPADIKKAYDLILTTASKFLYEGMHTPMQFLVAENPTYEETARLIELARQLMQPAFHDHDPLLADQANEYCYLMVKIGAAIRDQDEAALKEHCTTLAKKPFVLPE